ncbi:MAG: PorP/SprF family type IX secretion system membrane protein [Bacteroidota bacterium]
MGKVIFIILIIIPATVFSQDPQFSQPGGAMMYNNPAFFNRDTMGHVFMTYRNQWPKLEGNYRTFATGFSQYLSRLNGYAGILYSHDAAGALTTNRVSFIYAQNIPLSKKNKKIFLRPAFEIGYFKKKLDWNDLTFGDMIDPRRGFVYQTGDVPGGGVVTNVDFSAGTLFWWNNLTLGFSLHHWNEPNESLLNGNSPLPLKLGAQAAWDIKIMPWRMVITPYAWVYSQSMFNQTVAGINYKFVRKYILYNFGGNYRWNDAINIIAGVEYAKAKLFYSFDITTGSFGFENTGGTHEISLAYSFWKRPASKRWRSSSSEFF